MRIHLPRFVAVVLATLALAGCGLTRGKADAARGMDHFHELYNDSEFEKIYDTADPAFQHAMGRSEFLTFIGAVHRKLGTFISCENKGWKTFSGTGGTTVTLNYKSTFEKGTGDETFLFLVSGSHAALQDYHINSNTLVTE